MKSNETYIDIYIIRLYSYLWRTWHISTPALADLMHSDCWLEVALYCVETLPGLHNTLLTAVTMVHTATRNTATRNF